jgi:hypothetical protein
MKLYIAMMTTTTFNEGDFEHILGVFSTPELAAAEFKTQEFFDEAQKMGEFKWKFVFDGELTEWFEVIPCELDKGLHDY